MRKRQKKILLSWIDYRFDFEPIYGTTPSKTGINYEAHQYWYERMGFDQHILLQWVSDQPAEQDRTTTNEDLLKRYNAGKNLLIKLQGDFPGREIKLSLQRFRDPLHFPTILSLTQELLASLKGNELHILINSGYQMMQYAWIYSHISFKDINTHIIQVRKKEYTISKTPEPEHVVVEKLKSGYALFMQQGNYIPEEVVLTPTLEAIYKRAETAALSSLPVLIIGESGTGKEQLAQYIHNRGHKMTDVFYTVNCAAFTDELLRSELFGHAKNSFTGANADKQGFFEVADGGTLFLDEIGDTSPYIQQSLLRVIQSGTYYPVGDTQERKTKVKLITATNKQITPGHKDTKFREDLYYRLSVLRLELPAWREYPLDERQEILEELELSVAKESEDTIKKFSKDARRFLLNYPMPGNFRQLHNLLRRLYVFYAEDTTITLSMLQNEMEQQPQASSPLKPTSTKEEAENWHFKRALDHFEGNITKTAASLGISYNTLKTRIEKHGW